MGGAPHSGSDVQQPSTCSIGRGHEHWMMSKGVSSISNTPRVRRVSRYTRQRHVQALGFHVDVSAYSDALHLDAHVRCNHSFSPQH